MEAMSSSITESNTESSWTYLVCVWKEAQTSILDRLEKVAIVPRKEFEIEQLCVCIFYPWIQGNLGGGW